MAEAGRGGGRDGGEDGKGAGATNETENELNLDVSFCRMPLLCTFMSFFEPCRRMGEGGVPIGPNRLPGSSSRDVATIDGIPYDFYKAIRCTRFSFGVWLA